MRPDVRHVPVSLRRAEGALFLPTHPVTFHDEAPDPVDHDGRSYVFTHTVDGGYRGGATIYVFSST